MRYSNECVKPRATMSLYFPSESGARVNTIKQKFEKNISAKDIPVPSGRIERNTEESRDSLRRSLSASPVKSKKTLRPNVSRQLSNPSKNIKRTPAFRGEKPSRTRNLQSPTKEKLASIVDRNVRIFEEGSESGKSDERNIKIDKNPVENSRQGTCENEDRVRTRVISRQKNISPIYSRDERVSPSSNEKSEYCSNRVEEETNRFFKNGAEYTRVVKSNNPVVSSPGTNGKDVPDVVDGCASISRRIGEGTSRNDSCNEEKLNPEQKIWDTRLNDSSLRAALRAPLPSGPPPKKPPRTFAHSRRECKVPEPTVRGKIAENEISKTTDANESFGTEKEPRDSKKMLEKLERVLIQHRRALGPKVIMARNEEKNESSKKENNETVALFSRTLDDSVKFRSQTQDWPCRKHSTVDRLPSLDRSIWNNNDDDDDDDDDPKSEDSIDNSIPKILPESLELYDQVATSPDRRLSSTRLSSFFKQEETTGKPSDSNSGIEERVYAEPFAHDKNSGTDITSYGILTPEERNYFSRSLDEGRFTSRTNESQTRSDSREFRKSETSKPELHYMCTSIEPLVYEDNNNVGENYSLGSNKVRCMTDGARDSLFKMDYRGRRTEPDKSDKLKVEQLLNRAFGKFPLGGGETPSDSNPSSDTDSLASSASMSDELSSFNEKLRLFKSREFTVRPSRDELHRSLTEKRKNYVRRVSSKYSEKRDGASLVDGDKLFQVCLLVELDLSTREPYIKDKYPVYAKTPAWIENFCFPDATDWPPNGRSSQNQFYSLALMDEKGNRRYGYCCRVKPEDGPILPLAYCLITKHRASGFYRRVLLELESRHGSPDKRRRRFIEELYNSPMPKPGQSLCVRKESTSSSLCCSTITVSTDHNDEKQSNNNFLPSSFIDSSNKSLIDSSNDSNAMQDIVTRSDDPRLEERDMSQLFDAVSDKVLVILFASLLLERKVVLLCDKLTRLSSCVEALQSLLYPFTWPHTFVPVLPDIPGLSEILEAPLPFVIGIFKAKNSPHTRISSLQDGIIVDLDTSKIVHAVGDESSILPSRLQKKIRSALRLVSSDTNSGDGIRNFLVSEAFLRAFVETCSHYDSHIVTQQDGKVIFQKESFIKACSSKNEQYFLEWFVETTMFNTFIQDCIESVQYSGSCERDDIKLFNRRVAEYRKTFEKSGQTKKNCTKKKSLGDRLKDLTNFHA